MKAATFAWMKNLKLIIVALCMVGPLTTFGWGKRGHEMVAEVANTMLTEKAKEGVKKYLGSMSIEQASTWMDDIKSDHSYHYMSVWHYLNVEKGAQYQADTKEENVINELKRVIEELKHMDKMKEDDIKTDILVLYHLVGDMHQPLHVGYGVDKGGNDIHLLYLSKSSNLHRVWDSEIIEGEHITLANCLTAGQSFDKSDLDMFRVIDPIRWMNLPRSQLGQVYNFSDNKIDQTYVDRNKKLIKEDIYVAGVRLAAVLNTVFQ